MLKRFLKGAACSLLMLSAAPSMAEEVRGYAGVMGGFNNLVGTNFQKTTAGTTTPYSARFKDAGFGGAFVGASWESGFRLEGELAYRQNKIKTIDTVAEAKAHAQMWTLMANAYYNIPLQDSPVTPYVGAGAGAVRSSIKCPTASFSSSSKQRNTFMGQLMAGVGFKLNEETTLSVEYRAFRANNQKWKSKDLADTTAKARLQGHSVLASLRFTL